MAVGKAVSAVIRRVLRIYVDQAPVLMPAAAVVFAFTGILAAVLVAASPSLVLVALLIILVATVLFTGMIVELVADVQDGRRDASARRSELGHDRGAHACRTPGDESAPARELRRLQGRSVIRTWKLAIEGEMFLDNAGTKRHSTQRNRYSFRVIGVAYWYVEVLFERFHRAQVHAGRLGRIVTDAV